MKIFGGLDEIIEGISVKISTEFQFIHTDIAVIEDIVVRVLTAQKLKFSIKDFFSKCDKIRRKMRLWSHLLKKSLMENFIFCAVTFPWCKSDEVNEIVFTNLPF